MWNECRMPLQHCIVSMPLQHRIYQNAITTQNYQNAITIQNYQHAITIQNYTHAIIWLFILVTARLHLLEIILNRLLLYLFLKKEQILSYIESCGNELVNFDPALCVFWTWNLFFLYLKLTIFRSIFSILNLTLFFCIPNSHHVLFVFWTWTLHVFWCFELRVSCLSVINLHALYPVNDLFNSFNEIYLFFLIVSSMHSEISFAWKQHKNLQFLSFMKHITNECSKFK